MLQYRKNLQNQSLQTDVVIFVGFARLAAGRHVRRRQRESAFKWGRRQTRRRNVTEADVRKRSSTGRRKRKPRKLGFGPATWTFPAAQTRPEDKGSTGPAHSRDSRRDSVDALQMTTTIRYLHNDLDVVRERLQRPSGERSGRTR